MVQSGSYYMQCNRDNEGALILNKNAEIVYLRDDSDWLNIVTWPEGDDNGAIVYKKAGYMYKNGVYFDNEMVDGITGATDEHGDVSWTESQETQVYIPWLAGFQWDDDTVAFMGHTQDDDGECIMLRVDEHFFGREDYAPNYFVNFYFDTAGNFIKVKLSINLFLENEFTETESIVSLDPEFVAAEIDAEYQRAIG